MQSYDYANRKGVKEISWNDFAALAEEMAEGLTAHGIETIVGIARAGLLPATTVAAMLRRDLYPVRLSRRENDEVKHKSPVWKVPVSPDVAGKVVAVVDEIADTGETLRLVCESVLANGATQVVSACLVRHTWAKPAPDVCPLVTDELVIFPWDKNVFMDGRWQMHPELVGALKLQDGNQG
jgi:uncharacterized protein